MFSRTTTRPEAPEHDRLDLEHELCPPHDFEQGWGLAPNEDLHADTVPVLYCKACADVRLLRVPA